MKGSPPHHYTIQRLQGCQTLGVTAKTDKTAASAWARRQVIKQRILALPFSLCYRHHRHTLSLHPHTQMPVCSAAVLLVCCC